MELFRKVKEKGNMIKDLDLSYVNSQDQLHLYKMFKNVQKYFLHNG